MLKKISLTGLLFLMILSPVYAQDIMDLEAFLKERGSLEMRLFRSTGEEAEERDDAYQISLNQEYSLQIFIKSREGFSDQQYVLSFPESMKFKTGRAVSGEIQILKDLWAYYQITEDQDLILCFSETIRYYQNVYFDLNFSVIFSETGDFFLTDNTTVQVKPATEPIEPSLKKTGEYDLELQAARWQIEADLPGFDESVHEAYPVYSLADNMIQKGKILFPDFSQAKMILVFEDEVIEVLNINKDMGDYAYRLDEAEADRLDLLMRCRCGSYCFEDCIEEARSWCSCWTERRAARLQIEYLTPLSYVPGNKIINYANMGEHDVSSTVKSPEMLDKRYLLQENNRHSWEIEINPEETNLGKDRILVEDQLSSALCFLPESLEIYELKEGEEMSDVDDYTAEFSDDLRQFSLSFQANEKSRFLIRYTTMFSGQSLTVSNEANLSIGTLMYSEKISKKLSYDAGAARLSVELLKYENGTTQPVAGAVYGLYDVSGKLMAQKETDTDGKIEFCYDFESNLFLFEDQIYFIKEIEAPKGYSLDEASYWFCFQEEKQYEFPDQTVQLITQEENRMIVYDSPIFLLPQTGFIRTPTFLTKTFLTIGMIFLICFFLTRLFFSSKKTVL